MDALRATIVSAFPDLKDETVKVLAGGWDSVNWLVFPPVAVALALVAWQARQGRALPRGA